MADAYTTALVIAAQSRSAEDVPPGQIAGQAVAAVAGLVGGLAGITAQAADVHGLVKTAQTLDRIAKVSHSVSSMANFANAAATGAPPLTVAASGFGLMSDAHPAIDAFALGGNMAAALVSKDPYAIVESLGAVSVYAVSHHPAYQAWQRRQLLRQKARWRVREMWEQGLKLRFGADQLTEAARGFMAERGFLDHGSGSHAEALSLGSSETELLLMQHRWTTWSDSGAGVSLRQDLGNTLTSVGALAGPVRPPLGGQSVPWRIRGPLNTFPSLMRPDPYRLPPFLRSPRQVVVFH